MEPQLEGCGKGIKRTERRPVHGASMEPQLEGCGKRTRRAPAAEPVRTLQWSRNLRVAERWRPA